MNIIKLGTKEDVEARTKMMQGDVITIQFPKSSATGCLLLQVERPGGPKMFFEGTATRDGKVLVHYRDSTKKSAKYLVEFLCQITGLEAELLNEADTFICYVLKEGDKIFSD